MQFAYASGGWRGPSPGWKWKGAKAKMPSPTSSEGTFQLWWRGEVIYHRNQAKIVQATARSHRAKSPSSTRNARNVRNFRWFDRLIAGGYPDPAFLSVGGDSPCMYAILLGVILNNIWLNLRCDRRIPAAREVREDGPPHSWRAACGRSQCPQFTEQHPEIYERGCQL